jgi:hypothetical protein
MAACILRIEFELIYLLLLPPDISITFKTLIVATKDHHRNVILRIVEGCFKLKLIGLSFSLNI